MESNEKIDIFDRSTFCSFASDNSKSNGPSYPSRLTIKFGTDIWGSSHYFVETSEPIPFSYKNSCSSFTPDLSLKPVKINL